jgi:alpha-L-fucosidase 2
MTAIFNTDICGGLPAAIIQCLMQSSLTQIELLPVLPDSWPDGSITGICARGGITLDIEWRDHRLQRVRMCSNNDRTMNIVYGELRREVAFEAGATVALDSTLAPS